MAEPLLHLPQRHTSADEIADEAVASVVPPDAPQPKDTVRALLDDVPDDCTIDDVLYHLSVVSNVERGQAEADAGKLIPHAQVAEELRLRWVAGHRGP